MEDRLCGWSKAATACSDNEVDLGETIHNAHKQSLRGMSWSWSRTGGEKATQAVLEDILRNTTMP